MNFKITKINDYHKDLCLLIKYSIRHEQSQKLSLFQFITFAMP